uniref:F-box domain-containing protein n=1 Tax=Ditylum brightwellii TaxID=49249 RepID=A0A7S4QRW8_9STRA
MATVANDDETTFSSSSSLSIVVTNTDSSSQNETNTVSQSQTTCFQDKCQDPTTTTSQYRHHSPRIHILSATYGPSNGRRLLQGDMTDTTATTTVIDASPSLSSPTTLSSAQIQRLVHTRDVTPFVRLLVPRQFQHQEEEEGHGRRMQSITIPIMYSRSMNALFGDPCLGTTKCLRVSYYFEESDEEDVVVPSPSSCGEDGKSDEKKEEICKTTTGTTPQNCKKRTNAKFTSPKQKRRRKTREIYNSIFEEHDQVVLKRNILHYNEEEEEIHKSQISTTTTTTTETTQKWTLRPNISEIVLPMILPYLKVLQRAQCQLVCHAWLLVVRDRGVATTVNINDASSFPVMKQDDTAEEEEDSSRRSYLRGIVKHSHSSLVSLILNDFCSLVPQDLHPALPHLRKLQTLDISRCIKLTNATLELIGEHLSNTLQVLSIKGLRSPNVSDEGVVAVCTSCTHLKVLDVSDIRLTDTSGVSIGTHLTSLVALYMRNNYCITDVSVDVIMKNCGKLNELVLWGCAQLRHLNFGDANDSGGGGNLSSNNRHESNNSAMVGGFRGNDGGRFVHAPYTANQTTTTTTLACDKIVLLNLWGCFRLSMDAVSSMASLRNLKSLILSECHKLTDEFVVSVFKKKGHDWLCMIGIYVPIEAEKWILIYNLICAVFM